MTKIQKYEFTGNTTIIEGHTLKEIRALIDLPATEADIITISAGDLGGYIEDESNLSQEDNSWIHPNVMVYNNSVISGDARLNGLYNVSNSKISGLSYMLSMQENRDIIDSTIQNTMIFNINITNSELSEVNIELAGPGPINGTIIDSKCSNVKILDNNTKAIKILSIINSNITDFVGDIRYFANINIENVKDLSGNCDVEAKPDDSSPYIDINNVEKVYFDTAYLSAPVIITNKQYIHVEDPSNSKYLLNYDDIIYENGIKLYRIQSLINFGNVSGGQYGGYVPSLYAIRQDDFSWVDYDAKVVSNTVRIGTKIDQLGINSLSRLLDNSRIEGDVFVCLGNGDNHRLEGNSIISNIKIDEKKYSLTEETIDLEGKTLYRIKAEKSFSDVAIGDLGGFVETENNLSQQGNSWLYNDAKVFENAKVIDNAKVLSNAKIFGNAIVRDNAIINDEVEISGKVDVSKDGEIIGRTKISSYE